MPTLSVFFGIVVRMYYDDHPPPHFHAIYGEFEAHIGLDPLEIIKGKPPRRALELVLDWAELHAKRIARELGQGTAPRDDVLYSAFGVIRCTA